MQAVYRLFLCLLPFVFIPLLALLIAEGYLNFGGGEKDLLLLIPWLIWALVYAIVFIVLWLKGYPTQKLMVRAVGYATGLLAVLWLCALLYSFAGTL